MTADPTNAERKARMRQRRKDGGLTEVRVWLTLDELKNLSQVMTQTGIKDRTAALIYLVRQKANSF